jgi:hypothetical protein
MTPNWCHFKKTKLLPVGDKLGPGIFQGVRLLKLGGQMNDKDINQTIGYAILAIVVYFILQAILPFLIIGIVGLIIYQVVYRKKP